MMSGLVSPKSLGLTDEQKIRKLLKLTKILEKVLNYNAKRICPAFTAILLLTFYAIKTNLMETICYGIPNAIILSIFSNYVVSIIFYQILILFVISSYLKMKINSLNERLSEIQKRKRFIRIREILQSFDSLYSEINEYNTTFWSKILFFFWFLFGNIIIFSLVTILFGNLDLISHFIIFYTLFTFGLLFLLVIFTASSVTYCANKSYKTLNSLIISYSKHNKHLYRTRIFTNLKV